MTETIITVTTDQPYKVEGNFSIATDNSLEIKNKTVYLCSCGQSEKKPYCDGSHTKPIFIEVNLDELKPREGTRNVQIKYK